LLFSKKLLIINNRSRGENSPNPVTLFMILSEKELAFEMVLFETGILFCSKQFPGANPTIVIYSASVVNFYNATGSLARFENKNILLYFEKRSSPLQRWRCSCKFKNRRIGSS
jgi:hypothetical protein